MLALDKAHRRPKEKLFINPKAAEQYKKHIAVYARVALAKLRERWPLNGSFSLFVWMRFQDRHPRDADRVLNAVCDAGKGLLWRNDTWEYFTGGISLFPSLDREHPGLDVLVYVVPGSRELCGLSSSAASAARGQRSSLRRGSSALKLIR